MVVVLNANLLAGRGFELAPAESWYRHHPPGPRGSPGVFVFDTQPSGFRPVTMRSLPVNLAAEFAPDLIPARSTCTVPLRVLTTPAASAANASRQPSTAGKNQAYLLAWRPFGRPLLALTRA